MNLLKQAIRTLLFLILAFFGLIMAMVFMASTILAICILYVVARLKGKPFGVKAYWQERRRANSAQASKWSKYGDSKYGNNKQQEVVDIEMREIH